MSFLSPWLLPIALGLTVPPLVLLYFLKLKRREVQVSSTLLWRQAVQDLQVNAPFQKLRNNLLLILQLLILLAAALAIAEPMRKGARGVDKAIIVMIDQSASMAAAEDSGRSRLEIAKAEARKVIDDMSTAQRAMVIAFADRARVLTSFTDDKGQLRRAIDSVEQTDASGRLREAMELAEAHSTPLGEGVGVEMDIAESHYMVFTDGRLPDAPEVVVQRGELEVVRVGRSSGNVGIVELDVRRDYERPEQLSVLARVRNFGGEPASRDLSLLVDGQLQTAKPLGELAPLADPAGLAMTDLSGLAPEGNEAMVAFELTLDRAAELEVRLSGEDAFATDDRAWAIVAPPRPVSALLVTPGNRYLRYGMESLPLGHHEVWAPDEYEAAPDETLIENGRCRFDVVILDGHDTARLPAGNYLFWGCVPLVDGVSRGETLEQEVLLDWDDTHPVLRRLAIEAMIALSWFELEVPDEAVTLIDATNGPVMALMNHGRNRYLISAMGIFQDDRQTLNTDWALNRGLPMFMYNAVRFLAGHSTAGQQPPVSPGEPFTVSAEPSVRSVAVRRPTGEREDVAVRADGLVTYGRTERVGVYAVSTGIPGEDARAVNLLDESESFITPRESLQVAAGELKQTEGLDRVNRPLWPILLAALAAILFAEWFVYNRRMHV